MAARVGVGELFCEFAVWLDQLVFEGLLDLPEGVGVADVFEDEFALLGGGKLHVLLLAGPETLLTLLVMHI